MNYTSVCKKACLAHRCPTCADRDNGMRTTKEPITTLDTMALRINDDGRSNLDAINPPTPFLDRPGLLKACLQGLWCRLTGQNSHPVTRSPGQETNQDPT